MPEQRIHSDIVISVLVLTGVVALLGALLNSAFDLPDLGKAALWFVATFLAAHVARRLLLDLETSELVVAAILTIAVTFGIKYQRDARPLDLDILAPLGVALAGALAGTFTARTPASVPVAIRVIGAGAAAFGGSMLGVGITGLLGGSSGTGVLLGGTLGAIVTTAAVRELRWFHAPLGLALYFATLLGVIAAAAGTGIAAKAALGGGLGAFLGAIGGAIGVRLRRAPRATLPTARQVD